MFSFLKNKFFSFCSSFSQKIKDIFSSKNFGEAELEQLFETLVSFDLGAKISRKLVEELKSKINLGEINDSSKLLEHLKLQLSGILKKIEYFDNNPEVIVLFGINGAGKTTSAAKLANFYKKNNKKVLLVAADTYRAAAVEQLQAWAKNTDVDLFIGKENSDPASVIFDSAKAASQKAYDHVIIDTSGRLHTNVSLLKELEKSNKVTDKVFAGKKIARWIVIDSMLGQNSFEQVKTFKTAINLDGVVLTKLDGSAKGGVIFAIAEEFKIPVIFGTAAENDLNGIFRFDSKDYIEKLFNRD